MTIHIGWKSPKLMTDQRKPTRWYKENFWFPAWHQYIFLWSKTLFSYIGMGRWRNKSSLTLRPTLLKKVGHSGGVGVLCASLGGGLGWEEPDAPGPPPVLKHGLTKRKQYIQSIFNKSLRPSCNFDWRHETQKLCHVRLHALTMQTQSQPHRHQLNINLKHTHRHTRTTHTH